MKTPKTILLGAIGARAHQAWKDFTSEIRPARKDATNRLFAKALRKEDTKVNG